MPTLHALLIAINDYPNHPLQGCINDLQAMQTTLQHFCEKEVWQYNVSVLQNQEATRERIIEEYGIFKKAEEGDTCVVYYVGHGYRVAASPQVWSDGDSFHEAILTYDADVPGGRGLINKELSYLLWANTNRVKTLQRVEIFDCCHAGGITRSEGSTAVVTARTVAGDSIPIPKEAYLGYQTYMTTAGGRLAPPIVQRVQLAASTHLETAKEIIIDGKHRGVFTTALCSVLEENHFELSYTTLISKLSITVDNYIQSLKKTYGAQSPQLDCEGVDERIGVFSHALNQKALAKRISYSQEHQCWMLKEGFIQNIYPNTIIRVAETKAIITIENVYQNYSLIDLDSQYDTNRDYFIEILHASNPKISIAFAKNIPIQQQLAFQKALEQHYNTNDKTPTFFDIIASYNNTQLVIQCQNDDFYVTTFEDQYTPLFLRRKIQEFDIFFEHLEKTCKWFIANALKNEKSRFESDAIEVNFSLFHPEDNYQRAFPQQWHKQPILCNYSVVNGEMRQPRFAMAIKNKTHRDLWISVLYLSADFAITNQVIPTGKHQVVSQEQVRLSIGNEEKIWLSIPSFLKERGVVEITEYIKIIVSTDELNTAIYNQDALPFDAGNRAESSRGIANIAETAILDISNQADWQVYSIALNISLPNKAAYVNGNESSNPKIANHSVSVPLNFAAQISTGAIHTAQRSIGATPDFNKLSEAGLSPYFFSEGLATATSQSTLIFEDIQHKEIISTDQPVVIHLPESNTPEKIIALSYDVATDFFFPTGFENDKGQLEIHTIPDTTFTNERSLKESVIMFIQKVGVPIFKPTQSPSDDYFYKLRAVTIPHNIDEDTIYEANKDIISQKVASAKKIIVFIHGIIGDTTDQVKCLKRMQTSFEYDLILAYDYENLDTSIQDIAQKLKDQLASIGLQENHSKEVHIVAHSMGGLVSRWFIEQLHGDKIVSKLIMVGTPNNGSEIAYATTYVTIAVVSAVNFACTYAQAPAKLRAALSFGAKYATNRLLHTLAQMNPNGDFIKSLNSGIYEGKTPYYIIAGDIFSIQSSFKANGFFKTLTTIIEKGVGNLIYGEANDIAVRVASISGIKGIENQHIHHVAVDHMSYFADPKGVGILEQVLASVNQKQQIVQPPIPTTTPEANSIGIFKKIWLWILQLFR